MNTSNDITEQVEQCHICKHYFVLELEGSGNTCDVCMTEPDHSQDQEFDHWQDGTVAL